MNLTGSTEWTALSWLFEEALWAHRIYPEGERRHLDIGSGAGFPAIPLRILRPNMQLCMVESRFRRSAFLETVLGDLDLSRCSAVCGRIEEMIGTLGEKRWDIVSWKALKLSTRALDAILRNSSPEVRFWAFHGSRLPFEEVEEALDRLQEIDSATMADRSEHWLSIFVSRET
jgi:16S rRNA (guanine527-N7)-methyltransferase